MAGGELAVAIGAGALADTILGDPKRFHPVAGFGRMAAALERHTWRPRRQAGSAFVCGLVGIAALCSVSIERALSGRRAVKMLFTTSAVWAALGGRSLAREGLALARLVERGDLDEARRIAPSLMGRDPRHLDGPELCRGAVESVAENTADAVLGPLLWAAVAGAPGAIAYRAANTLDAMVGHRDDRYSEFGWAAARLDDLMTWPAARAGALLTVILAPLVEGGSQPTWRILRRDGRSHPSPNAGLLEAAFAGALAVRLGGVNRYGERIEQRPHLGEGGAPTPVDIRRAIRLSRLVSGAGVAVAMALAWWIHR